MGVIGVLLWFVLPMLVLLAVLYFIWSNFADADLTLLWNERFGLKADVLKGEVVWITGASSGIGKYLALELARVGCKLVLSARSTDELNKVRQECLQYGKLNESDVLVLTLDMVNTESHAAATQTVLNTFGHIDVLVNNAGRSQRAYVVDTDLAVDREIINLNIIGPMSLTKCVLPHMISRRSGQIVVTSSVTGKMPVPFSATYCLSKWAVIGYFHSLATEVAQHNIGVTIACPGPTYSNLLAVAYTDTMGQLHGGRHEETSRSLMKTSRCAELMVVAIANKISEVWISFCPFLFLCYFSQYFPSFFVRYMCNVGADKVTAMRTGK